jgi:class 3 adenylate cyclase
MWSAAMDVGGWLRGLGLGEYEDNLRNNKIDADVLPQLTAEDLRDMGVVAVGDRRRLLSAIAALADATHSGDAPASPPAHKGPLISAERRPMAVMFCDLVGSTDLASQLDAEDGRNIVNAYLDEASKAVTALGGHVQSTIGDGLMALFGYPKAQENDGERAVRAALAIQIALVEINAKNAGKGVPELSARIGIESGRVVVDASGKVFGEAPNVAARVQAAAAAHLQAAARVGWRSTLVVLKNPACQQSGLWRLFRCRIYAGSRHRRSRASRGIRADRFWSQTKRL